MSVARAKQSAPIRTTLLFRTMPSDGKSRTVFFPGASGTRRGCRSRSPLHPPDSFFAQCLAMEGAVGRRRTPRTPRAAHATRQRDGNGLHARRMAEGCEARVPRCLSRHPPDSFFAQSLAMEGAVGRRRTPRTPRAAHATRQRDGNGLHARRMAEGCEARVPQP